MHSAGNDNERVATAVCPAMAVAFRCSLVWRGMNIGSCRVLSRAIEVYSHSLSCLLTSRTFARLTVCLLEVKLATTSTM